MSSFKGKPILKGWPAGGLSDDNSSRINDFMRCRNRMRVLFRNMKMFKRDNLTFFSVKIRLWLSALDSQTVTESDKFQSLFIAELGETLAFPEFINYSQVLMFAKLLGWAMHLHSYLECDKGNFKKKVLSLFYDIIRCSMGGFSLA